MERLFLLGANISKTRAVMCRRLHATSWDLCQEVTQICVGAAVRRPCRRECARGTLWISGLEGVEHVYGLRCEWRRSTGAKKKGICGFEECL